jgi:hypothetical protein
MANKTSNFIDNSPPKADATWLNMVTKEIANAIPMAGDVVDSSAGATVNTQLLDCIKSYVSQAGILCTDTSSGANVYVVNASTPFTNPVLKTGTRIRFKTTNANTGSSTIAAFGGSAVTCKKSDGSTNLVANDIPANSEVEFVYNGTNWVKTSYGLATTTNQGVSYLNNPITIANNTTTPNTKIDFLAGVMTFDDGSGQINASAMTGDLAKAFGTDDGMLDTGTKASTSDYSLFAIYNPTTGIIKPLASLSRTAPTMPSGFTKKDYRGKILTDASGNIIGFKQYKDLFEITGSLPYKAFPANTTTYTDISFATNYIKEVEQIINSTLYATVTTGINSQILIRAKNYTDGINLSSGDTNSVSVTLRFNNLFNVMSDSSGVWQYRTTNSTSFVVGSGYGFYLKAFRDYNLKI